MLKRKTVGSVVAKLQGIIDDLITVKQERTDEAEKQGDIEFTASVAAKEAVDEANKAGRIQAKIQELLE